MDGYAVSQFAGGGFISTSQEASAVPAASQQTQEKNKSANNQTLRAVTVKQLIDGTANTPDDQYRIDGVDLDNITLVGKIVSMQEQATNLSMVLDDGTGTVDLKYWIDSDETEMLAQRKVECQVGVFVRVHGHLRAFSGEKNIVTFNIRPVTDFNEVTYHGLQVIFQHLHITKGNAFPPADATKAEAPSPMQAAQTGFNAASGGAGAGDNGFSLVQNAVANVLKEGGPVADGLSLQEITNRLEGRYNTAAVAEAAGWLCTEGHAYQPDGVRYKSTDC